MLRRRKYPYLANVLLVIAIFSIHAAAQDKNIWNEYRPSLISAMPINEKWIAWQYTVARLRTGKETNYDRLIGAGHYLQAVRHEGQAAG